MRIAQGRFGRELLMVQDGSVAASATQPALPWRGVGVGTCNQSLIFQKIINRVRPSHHHILMSRSLWAAMDRRLTKGGVYRRQWGGGDTQTKQGLGEPPSLSVKDEEGNCRPLLVSIVYASAGWWELAGKLPRAEICSADAFSRRKKCTLSRWWFLKELSLRRKKKKKGFLSEEGP